jgi:hypothetical protein
MQRKLEARAAGLPEPPDLEPPLPQPPLDMPKKKKEPKKSKKVVSLEALKKRLNDSTPINDNANSSKFSVLSDMG